MFTGTRTSPTGWGFQRSNAPSSLGFTEWLRSHTAPRFPILTATFRSQPPRRVPGAQPVTVTCWRAPDPTKRAGQGSR